MTDSHAIITTAKKKIIQRIHSLSSPVINTLIKNAVSLYRIMLHFFPSNYELYKREDNPYRKDLFALGYLCNDIIM